MTSKEFSAILKDAAQKGMEYKAYLDSIPTCGNDGCNRDGTWDGRCFNHQIEYKRAKEVERAGGHNLETYRLNKVRHQSTRGMIP